MAHTRTTPPRPADVSVLFPGLAPLARAAIRLHPRPGSPSPQDSSVGGPLLWPAAEPWPHCELWHEGVDGPIAMVPVLQLHVRDVPLLQPPGRADLLQVLCCTFEHPPEYKPPTALVWRSAAEVTDVLAAPPEPHAVEYDSYIPKPCVLAPEEITEYPDLLAVDKETHQQLADWNTWRSAGVEVDGSYEIAPQEFYGNELSVAPGWKVGGWPSWGLTDPVARFCIACGAEMSPLVTIASNEWDASSHGWVPYEDRELAALRNAAAANPPGVTVSRGNHLQLYVCPDHPYHPHTDLIQ
ncbi:hypothetical protein [Streptomyces sp. 184]|uniref:hypothetical protein n=1 Tax=Streptomyces sp. 184 TaxID=1827526 RepID=UPI003891E184